MSSVYNFDTFYKQIMNEHEISDRDKAVGKRNCKSFFSLSLSTSIESLIVCFFFF